MVALDVMLVQVCRLPLLCPPTPGQVVVVVGLLSIVEHPGPASVVQDVPRYFTISCSAQVSARLNINTCNGNEATSQIFILSRHSSSHHQIHSERNDQSLIGCVVAGGLWYCLICLISV